MHTSATGRYVKQSQQLRLNLDLGISNQQADNDIARETNLQMSGKNCKNIQHRRGRRRRHGHREGGNVERGLRGGFVGIFWSINLAILICLAHSTNAGKCCCPVEAPIKFRYELNDLTCNETVDET